MPNENNVNGGQVRFIKYDERLIAANIAKLPELLGGK